MEHAIRRHIKVNMEKDPALYRRFLERLQQIMERYRGNWENAFDELQALRETINEGRSEQTEEGLNEQELPFYDLILMIGYENSEEPATQEEKETIKQIVVSLVDLLQDAINKPNFWQARDSEIRKLKGEIDDIFDFSGIKTITENHDKLSVEVVNLAKKRHQELLDDKK